MSDSLGIENNIGARGNRDIIETGTVLKSQLKRDAFHRYTGSVYANINVALFWDMS